jgi:hypothetical protein
VHHNDRVFSLLQGAEGSDKKKAVVLPAYIGVEFRLSELMACKLLSVDRSSYRYESRSDRNIELREALVKLARQKPHCGCRRLHVLLEREATCSVSIRISLAETCTFGAWRALLLSLSERIIFDSRSAR